MLLHAFCLPRFSNSRGISTPTLLQCKHPPRFDGMSRLEPRRLVKDAEKRRLVLCSSQMDNRSHICQTIHQAIAGGVAVCAFALTSLVPSSAATAESVFLDGCLKSSKVCAGLTTPTTIPPLPTDFPTLKNLEPPSYREFTLANELTVFLVEDHELPIFRGTMLILGGSQADPPSEVGLSSIVATVQRSGGTVALPYEKLDEALESVGAAIEAKSGVKATSFGFLGLAEDAPRVLELLSDVIRNPAMPEERLEQARALGLDAVRHRFDSAAGIPRRKMQELLYGKDSPLARQTTADGLRGITREDLLRFVRTWQRPDAAVLGIAGDFDSDSMQSLITEVFQGWEPAPGEPLQPPDLPP
mmetsp:Transcript_8328/g.19965  ORF Transcript_8328/g.19965 Transcript_8328/m.19965 type:complete len:358 (+) Transcript_8328:251-1324(+)